MKNKAIGKTIKNISIRDTMCILEFTDSSKFIIQDIERSCCEKRYMTCDDDLEEFHRAIFKGTKLKYTNIIYSDGEDVQEIEFLDVITDKGIFTIASHNDHNGYYSGFDIVTQYIEPIN